MRMVRVLHSRIGVDDVLSLTICSWVDGIIRVFESCSRFPCFRSSGALVACHIFLSESLLDRFAFPIIVPNASSTFNDSGTKLTEH